MALVKYGGGILAMSGSIGGQTHARNRFGHYIRARTKPVNPRTALQTAVKAALAQVVERWSETLNDTQRTAWNDYASKVVMKNRLSEDIKLTGFNHYIRSNVQEARLPGTITDDGPTDNTLPGQDPAFAITATEAPQIVTIAFNQNLLWCSEDLAWMEVFLGSPQNPQRNFFAGPWRFMTRLNGNQGAPITSTQDWVPTFAIAEGQHVWAYARIRRADGRLSEKFSTNCFVSA